MIRCIIKGFKRRLLPCLFMFFLVMLAISFAEVIYDTPAGNWQSYTLICVVLAVVLAFMLLMLFVSFEYSLVGDVLAVRYLWGGKVRRCYIVYLRNEDVKLYTGTARLTNGLFRRRRLCYLPFCGGVFKVAAICYVGPKHKKIRLLFKPSVPMVTAINNVIANRTLYPEEDTFQ